MRIILLKDNIVKKSKMSIVSFFLCYDISLGDIMQKKEKVNELITMFQNCFLDINNGLNTLNVIEISMMIESVEKDMMDYSFSQDEREVLELYLKLVKMSLDFFQVMQTIEIMLQNYYDCMNNDIFYSIRSLLDSMNYSIKSFKSINQDIHLFDQYFVVLNKKVEKYYNYIDMSIHSNRHI